MRVLKNPLYGSLGSGADTSASGKECALPVKESRRRLPAEKRWRKRKNGTFFKNPDLKIYLVGGRRHPGRRHPGRRHPGPKEGPEGV
jgi:hypothetical protein